VDEIRIERFRADLVEWFGSNGREFAWRDPDASLYEVFVAEFFLTQTPAGNVADVYPEFLDEFPSLDAIERSDVGTLAEVIEPLGFHNMRSEALHAIATDYETLPDDPEALRELPRVGHYVSNATVCFARNEALPIVDRNVDRVYERVFGDTYPDSQSDRIEFADRLVPRDDPRSFNLALLDFGAAICGPEPNCPGCFATDYCCYYGGRVKQ
jgi:A/G-specific adenine glycosylase